MAIGDLVAFDGHVWDVTGCDTLDVADPDGTVPVRLHLERIYRPAGKRKQVFKARADSRQVALVGHQGALPGIPIAPSGRDYPD